MAKVRIYDLAKELSVSPKDLLDMLGSIGVANKVASSSVEETAARSLRQMISNRNNPEPEVVEAPKEVKPAAPAKFGNFQRNDFRARPAGATEEVVSMREEPEAIEAQRVEAQRVAAAPVAPTAPVAPPVAPTASVAPTAPPVTNNGNTGGNNSGGNNSSGNNNRGGGGYQGNRPYQGGNQGGNNNRGGGPRPGSPAPGAAPGGAPGAPTGDRPAITHPPVVNTSGITHPPVPPTSAPGGFAMGARDRRAFKSGRYRGNRGGGIDGPRFGDKDFRVETESNNVVAGDNKIVLSGPITVADLATKVRKPVTELVKALFSMSIMRSANQLLEVDVASTLASRYGYVVEKELNRTEALVIETEDPSSLVHVPPVVTIMGHVDHGKTSLLDRIRSAKVQSGEAGGITQRIGAYETTHNGERIVFLDTPGHEAFTRMRARGAHVTDIAILVVAADDGVMPQTREAIDHARAAKVPIIVAMNKMDRAEADPDRVLGELAETGLIPESYGGDITVVPVSAKTGDGVQELLDIILLVAELQELKANPNGLATGTIIEARQDPQRGPVATILIQSGTLKVGESVVVGEVYGRVRAMLDYNGKPLKEAGPKTPVFITGLSGVPHTSDTMRAVESARAAREQSEAFGAESAEGRQIGQGRSLNDMMARIQEGSVKELNVIVKADGQGSTEALCSSLEKLAHEEVRVRIISRGVGNVTENDVNLASASEAVILAFAVNADAAATALADREKVEIRKHEVIYSAIEEVKAALEGMLAPVYNEVYMGEAEVRDTFKSTRAGSIAGCHVTDGKMVGGSIMKLSRNKRQIFEGRMDSLRHFKTEIKEIFEGSDCGISSTKWNDFQVGDIIQCFIKERVKRTID